MTNPQIKNLIGRERATKRAAHAARAAGTSEQQFEITTFEGMRTT